MELLIQVLVAMIATLGFSILFHAPKKQLLLCALTGGVGWLAYLGASALSAGAPLASFVATLALMLVSRLLSAIRKTPTIVFLLAGILPLVPGAGIYDTAYYMFLNDGAMAGAMALETFKIAGAIVLGILFGYALPQGLFNGLAGIGVGKGNARAKGKVR